jgi:squalene synthase HpnC
VLLDWWHDELRRCYRGQAEHPVFVALRETIDAFEIPSEPFERLLAAFRQDQHQTRYATHDAVLAYCQNSANPVGRLILYLGRCHDERRGALSDSICTGLQLANFCQDVQRDWAAGRVYLPHATLEEAGCFEGKQVWGQPTPAFRKALAKEVDRAERYLRGGAPLVEMVPPVLRVQVALFVAGGLAVLSAIRRLDFDVWTARPTVGRWRKAQLLARCWWQYRLGGRREASS